MNTARPRYALAIAIVLTLLVPLSAAHDDSDEDTTDDLDYFLNTKDGNLTLTWLPPSARNATAWTTQLDPYWNDEVSVRLEMPAPAYDVNETAGIEGAVRANMECDPNLVFCDRIEMTIELVEGERRVPLGQWGLSSSVRTYYFHGDFPGHGWRDGPHTHGDGSDPDRPLRTDDIAFEATFRVQDSLGSLSYLTRGDYHVNLYVDGNSFAHLEAASGPRAAPAGEPVDEDNATAPLGNETGPNGTDDGNGTAGGNATNQSSSSAGAPDGHRVFVSDEATVQSPGVGLFAAFASIGFGVRRAQKRFTRRHH